uniref:F-box only protein 50 n=1 Tax=Ornithorhynchus anatinus TaxID=9258 RepID=F6PZT0_ORNAN
DPQSRSGGALGEGGAEGARSPPPPERPCPAFSPAPPQIPRRRGPPRAPRPSGTARQRLLDEWGPQRDLPAPLPPPGLTWQLLYLHRPLYRNLLRSPNPEGINVYEPAPPAPRNAQAVPLSSLGNFNGWEISTEKLQANYSWTVKQQCVDLLAEGLWEELLDRYQPDITVMDWYEDSQLDASVYELHVRLLQGDRRTVVKEYNTAPRTNPRGPPGCWLQVSHVFKKYGPGVRYVHFLHKTKDHQGPDGFHRTRVTDSSVSVQLRE